jgi:hypothetical protein
MNQIQMAQLNEMGQGEIIENFATEDLSVEVVKLQG